MMKKKPVVYWKHGRTMKIYYQLTTYFCVTTSNEKPYRNFLFKLALSIYLITLAFVHIHTYTHEAYQYRMRRALRYHHHHRQIPFSFLARPFFSLFFLSSFNFRSSILHSTAYKSVMYGEHTHTHIYTHIYI